MKRLVVCLGLLLLVVGVTGCGKYNYDHSSEFVRTEVEYKESGKQVEGYGLKNIEKEGRYLDFKVQAKYEVPGYKHDIYKKGKRTSKDPDLGMILNPMAYLIALIEMDFKPKQFFGYHGKWYYHEEKQNSRRNGSRMEWRNLPGRKEVMVSLNGSRWKGRPLLKDGAGYRLDVGAAAEALPAPPENITVRLRSEYKAGRKKFTFTSGELLFDAEQTAAMGLHSSEWELSADERMRKYMAALKRHVRASSYKEAVACFEKVEGLGIKLPPSFDYQYGKILIEAGYGADGRMRLERYLSQAGEKGKYSGKAKALMARSE